MSHRLGAWTPTDLHQSPRLRTAKEWEEQAALFTWTRLHEGVEPRLALFHHIPNGEKRPAVTAAKLQKMGVKSHIPDNFLPVATRHYFDMGDRWEAYHGCYIEMKRLLGGDDGREQLALHERLRAQGYNVVMRFGWVAAAEHLCWYLHRPDLAKELSNG
jgi:hypothetical protein